MPGDYRTLVVEQSDGLVLLEAPQGLSHAAAMLELIRERWPEMPILTVGVSHHHSDHVGGLTTVLTETGATVVAGPGMDAHIRELTSADSLATPNIIEVRDRYVIGSGLDRVEVHAVPNTHAESLVLFYLPEHRLVFQGDLLGLPYRGEPTASFEASHQLMRMIEERGLDVERIVAVHGGRAASMDDFRRVLSRPRLP